MATLLIGPSYQPDGTQTTVARNAKHAIVLKPGVDTNSGGRLIGNWEKARPMLSFSRGRSPAKPSKIPLLIY